MNFSNLIDWLSSSDGFATILSLVGTLIAVLIAHWLKGGVKLIAFSPNSTNFMLKPRNDQERLLSITSGQIIVQNDGRSAAHDIQIISQQGLSPEGYSILPAIEHTIETGPNNEWIFKTSYLGPKEVITIQLLNGPIITSIRSREGPAKFVNVIYQRVYPLWFNYSVASLIFYGLASLLFLLFSTIIK